MSEEKKPMDAERMKKIDEAIKRAQAQKAAGGVAAPAGESVEERAKRLAAERTLKVKEKDEEREAKRLARQAEIERLRAERKAERDKKREEKLASAIDRGPAHISKVEKAAANLPPMNEDTQLIFDEAKKLRPTDIEVLAAHLAFEARKTATIAASTSNLKVGQQVTIIGGQPRYIGQSGTVTKVQRIRCFVQLDSNGKEIYLFTSNVVPVATAAEPVPAEASEETSAPAEQPAPAEGEMAQNA